MKKCISCSWYKDYAEFGNNRSRADGKQPYCKKCGSEKDRRHYFKSATRKTKIAAQNKISAARTREYLIKYLLEHPCVDCGESDPFYLDFDHVRGTKKVNISACKNRSLRYLMEEIDKCDIRCVRCHRAKTAKEGGWYETYYETIRIIQRRLGTDGPAATTPHP